MPLKDPDKRRRYNRNYRKTYVYPEKKPGECSRPDCHNLVEEGFKWCTHHREYMKEYHKKDRALKKSPNKCSNTDCPSPPTPGYKTCEKCRTKRNEVGKTDEARSHRRNRNHEIKEEVLKVYGAKCACCGESHIQFLSIDHVEGFNGIGPRRGADLYRWLKKKNYPEGFRVLCMSCNFALGHHGYCPHGTLTSHHQIGRPRIHPINQKRSDSKRAYWLQYKLGVFTAYGGPVCACCGETHVECLSIDHINNDGAAHRKALSGNARDARNFYIWLRANGYPPGFQVLCMNCNFARGHFGVCPHETAGEQKSF